MAKFCANTHRSGEANFRRADAGSEVDTMSGEEIIHAIIGGKLAGKVCIKALEKNDFSFTFLSRYQDLWHKAADFFHLYSKYSYLYGKYLLSSAFLYLSMLDRNAYLKPLGVHPFFAITRAGARKVFNTLKFIYRMRWFYIW